MAFLRPPYTKKCIFETPLYKKLAFLRPPYTKKYLLPPSPFSNGITLIRERPLVTGRGCVFSRFIGDQKNVHPHLNLPPKRS
jgi:hypothetical protein